MDEVRLIEIPTTARDVGPVYFGASLNLEQYFLKPANPAKQLWRQAGLSPEEVKSTCGKPQIDDLYTLTYIDGDRRVVLQFMGANHRMFLNNVKWASSKGGVGEIRQVTKERISDFVKHGWLPMCLEDVAQ